MDGQDTRRSSRNRFLLDRFESLEASHQKLRQQFQNFVQEKIGNSSSDTFLPENEEVASDSERLTSFSGMGCFPGSYSFGSPYRSVLEYMGHAVHVSRTGSGEIIYWNYAAEKLYGYKDNEVVGQSVIELLFDEVHQSSVLEIMDRLCTGESWSGQLLLKKRSGQSFMAMVSKSPLYEEGKLTGIITVSSDAAIFNNTSSWRKFRKINLKRIQWHSQAQVLAVPEISSSFHNLIPKPVFGSSLGRYKNEGMSSQKEGSTSVFVQPPNIRVADDNIQQTSPEDSFAISNGGSDETCSHKESMGRESMANEPYVKSIVSDDTCSGPEIQWDDIQLKEEIGRGSFAAVYRGVWSRSDVAVKVYGGGQYTEKTLVIYKKEIDAMRRLRHPNVLLFMGAVCTGEKLAIVTEYLRRGSLFKTLHKNNQSLDTRRRLKMAVDVARGMNYLHHRNPPILHGDLKSSNLLVDKSWTVKVGDFGLSKLKRATFLTSKSGRGTPPWMAPEVLQNEPSTEKSDVFSFGVILWELMTERIPWGDLNSLQVKGVVGFMDRRLDLPENIDPRVRSIISQCWQSDPDNRPSFEDIISKITDLVLSGDNVSAMKLHTP
ncbi:protein kinase family protein [Striga asiatica]|uniref:non-specific serine/threonine protein kinase n=1 Tax=Striga asiatica TaxID=4170 RepID=A0A5A7Q8Y0_STRAF|nr:protein kinase family protein [Striga asiatica]